MLAAESIWYKDMVEILKGAEDEIFGEVPH